MSLSSSASISEDFELIDHQEANLEPEDRLVKLQGWLQPTDYTAESSEFNRHLSSQAPETGLWICETARYQQWRHSDDHGSLWVKGVPGAGKSVIAASMVEHLRTIEDVPVLFFFFRYIVASNRKPRNLIQDYLAQLLPQCPRLRATLQPLLGSELDHLSDERLWEFLLLGLASIEKAYCVVDAMDEMEVDNTFLQRLNDLATFRPKSVKLFMTSRPKQYLQSALRDASIVHISLEDDLVGKDIAVFITHRLKDVLPGDQNQQLRADLESTICERSRGLFLYARLLVDQIIPKLHATGQLDVQKLAKNLPVGLEDMYNDMLYQNTQSQKIGTDIQVFLLKFVTHSSRTLRLNELANALASEFPSNKLSSTPKNVARTACAPLLEILEDETVQVIHHSFTEFLLDQERSQNEGNGSTPQFPVLNPQNVHRNLAMTCLRYLQSGVLRHSNADEFENQSICKCNGDLDCNCRGEQKQMKDPYDWQASKLTYPFLEYAVLNWAFHCQKYDTEDKEFLSAVSNFLDPESPDFKQWLRIEWTTRQVPGAVRTPAPLHVAAFAGMTKYAALLLRSGLAVDPRDADERTPLHWACRRGHLDIASLLLKNGAEADAEDCRGAKPIHEAARRNHSGIVKLLLEAGVDPMTPKTKENHGGRLLGGERSTKGETAIEYASQQGHLDTVVVMLPYLKTESLGGLLGRACRHGEFEIAKAVLTSTDVSPNARFDGGTALYIATVAHNISIVKLLLRTGADPLEQCDYRPNYRINGGSRFGRADPAMAPIHALASGWNDETHIASHKILRMLLGAGADIEARSESGDTPLMSLFVSRSSATYVAVRSFLELGADVSATDKNGDCVLLHCLINCKDIEVIKLLFKYGAKVDVQGHKGNTVLHRILEHPNGNVGESINEILTFLLEKGAKPDVTNEYGRAALQQAILTRTCTFETFKVLLEKCEPTAAKQCMWLLGNRKSIEEEKQFIEVLLAHGASLEDRNSRGQTPILSDLRSQKAVEALRQCGASIHALDNNGCGILHSYIHITGGCPSLEGFKTYVDYGLNPKVVDHDGNTLLHAAAANFGETKTGVEFMEYLLGLGMSMNAKNKKGETPLMVNIRLARICSSSNEKRVSLLDMFRRHEKKEVLDLNVQDTDGIAAIHLATLRSEFQLSQLLSAGANPALVTKDKRNILHIACRARQTNTVALIVDKCKELIDSQDNDGRTPLHDACISGRPEAVFCLLQAGASIHLKDGNERTPLHACASYSLEQKLWSLLEYRIRIGSDPILSSIPKDQFRPGAGRGHEDKPWYNCNYMNRPRSTENDTTRIGGIIDMLLEAGADPLALDDRERFPLDVAIANDCQEMISKLAFTAEKMMEIWTVDEKATKKLPTLLAIKTISGGPRLEQLDLQTMKEVLDRPNTWMKMLDYPSFCCYIKEHNEELAQDEEAINRLGYEAASNGLTELISVLGPLTSINDDPSAVLTRISAETEIKRTRISLLDHAPILQTACSRTSYNLQILKVLVETCNADINARALEKPAWSSPPNKALGTPGPTALHILAKAKSFWQLSGIQYLVSKGADINALNEKGETPLHIASKGNVKTNMGESEGFWAPDAVKLLLSLGADPNILDNEGLSCLNKASSSPEIMKSLLEHNADLNIGKLSPLFTAIQSQDLDALKVLLDAGADPNSVDEKKGFQVHYTVKGDKIRYALFCACFPNLFNQQPRDSAPLVKLLIQRGADPYAILRDKETLIHYVFEHADEEIVFALLDKEVQGMIDWEKKDQFGRTVLLAAANWTGCLRGYRHKHWFDKVRAPVIRLLDLGVNPLTTDNEGKNALHHLCANEDMEEDAILQFLEHPSATSLLSQKDKLGYTPLHFALKVLRPKIVEGILELGKQENLLDPDPEGKTALHHIAAQCLEKHERQRASHLQRDHPPEWHSGVSTFWTKFLALGGNINVQDKLGNSPLLTFLAAPSHSSYSKPHSNSTSATENPHLVYLEKFFQEADFFVLNGKGENALHVIANRDGGGEADRVLFEVCMKKGLDPLAEDGSGRSCLDVVAARGKAAILELFERGGGK